MAVLRVLIVFSLIIFNSCSTASDSIKMNYSGNIIPGKWLKNLEIKYTVEQTTKTANLQIYFPKNYIKGNNIRTIICLHNYDGYMRSWEEASYIERYADNYNFVIICPNMRRTMYETKYYPETQVKWDTVPGGLWIGMHLVPYLQKEFALALDKDKTAIVGYSDGASGAILTAETFPLIFGAAAGLSGYYCRQINPKDRRMIAIYGEYKEFKDRWEKDDNFIDLAINLKDTPVFLAHGMKDYFYPNEQSRLLAIRLKQLEKEKKAGYKVLYIERNYRMGDWKFWREMVPEMMKFLDENLKK